LAAVATPVAAERAPALLAVEGKARLELSTGRQITAPLPEGAELETTASLEAGWLAVGTQPAAGGARELLLLTGDSRTVSALPSPPGRTGTLRQAPLPLIDGDHLAGLAWLEGESRRSLGVRFAAWNGAGWDMPQVVAPPGPGSQLALTAARLSDGSWLLAWSAFDGKDDEIVWSQGRNGSWSRAQRVTADNAVPDITPALTAVPGGALLAWSRYDGNDYRIVTSRFRNGRWTQPETAARAGSFYPTFEPTESGKPLLLYRTAVPQGWEALTLDTAGRPLRHAAVQADSPSDNKDRPQVTATAAGVAFRWPAAAGREQTAAWERRP
jgi:hypothetical protein